MTVGFGIGILIVIFIISKAFQAYKNYQKKDETSSGWSGTFYVEPIYGERITSYFLSEYLITAPAGRRFLQVEIIRR